MNKYKYLLFVFCVLSVHVLFGMQSKVAITNGADSTFQQLVSQRLTRVVNSLGSKNWQTISEVFTEEGLQDLKDLVKTTECRNVNPLYEIPIIQLPSGEYEVRNIKVKVDLNGTKGNPFQYMVFTVTPNGKVAEVRFAMEKCHYQQIIQEGRKFHDFAVRQKIIHFLEIFRTAYNRKDLEYLRRVYSDDAMIIVGTVLKPKLDYPDMLEQSSLSRDKIRFLRLSKNQYLDRLKRIFRLNSFVKVQFEEISIKLHPKFPEIYGVTLKQYWKSSTYSDEGWLFLMIDFKDPNHPLIHVRSWQPERFPDGSVVSLGDFEIIE